MKARNLEPGDVVLFPQTGKSAKVEFVYQEQFDFKVRVIFDSFPTTYMVGDELLVARKGQIL